MVAGYNQSDTSIGWFHFLTGMTLYYNDMNDSTLDNIYSGYFCVIFLFDDQLRNKKTFYL